MKDETLREGLKKFSFLTEGSIEDIMRRPNRLAIAKENVRPVDENFHCETILQAESLQELKNTAEQRKARNRFYYELEQAAREYEKKTFDGTFNPS